MCEDAQVATKKYGGEMAVEMLVQHRIGRCHQLQGDRKGQYAMDLTHPYRLIFEKRDKEIIAVEILEIVDYH